MGLWDVLTGRKPLMRSTEFHQRVLDVEQGYESLINSTAPYKQRKFPSANAAVIEAAYIEDTKARPSAAARFTLDTKAPVKVADTQGAEKRIFITVIGVGTTAFVSHNRLRLLNKAAGINEGIPFTNAGVGEPALATVPWSGEMWAIGDTDGMLVDVEMS